MKSAALHLKKKKHSKKHEKINCEKPQVKHQIFMGPMTKTQLLKIIKHYVNAKLTQSQTLNEVLIQAMRSS